MSAGSRYSRRIIDQELDDLMASLAAIAIEGPKAIGKTETAQRRAATIRRLDDNGERSLALADLPRVLEGHSPVLLDEWQRVPQVWDAVRRAVDDGADPGSFLLTGSAVPEEDDADAERHSGAARIVTLRMRPMSMLERLPIEATVSLRELLSGSRGRLTGDCDVDLVAYTAELVRSGFPGIRDLDGRAHRLQVASYLKRVVDRDFENELGQKVRRPETLTRWMRAYAAATASSTTFEKIRAGAAHGQEVPAKTTAASYYEALQRLFILDPLDGWAPTRNHLKRLTLHPKHHLADPALAVSLLGVNEQALLGGARIPGTSRRDGTLLGALFESLVVLSVRSYAQPLDAALGHLRTKEGQREVDLIVGDPSGRVVAIEVKLAPTPDGHDVRHLHWLQEQLGDDLADAIVVTTGKHAYRRPDGIGVVPLALLGP